MRNNRNLLLKIGLISSLLGFLVFLNPLHNEPMWAQWLFGPVLIYLGLPIAMVGAAIHFLGNTANAGVSPKPRA